ncbi:hypothetical protein HB770_04135 [Rhizobium leguminosarum bv. viciae]|uniref:Uncharacterized protein n=1 Tax=Rhizobium leguminosarum bv. viciae TaxID=387 RepID=A0A7G6RHV3_RHILV|nr:hypothetical protein HB770_04135 [Rhizobium leguminosarum bv. viciae]
MALALGDLIGIDGVARADLRIETRLHVDGDAFAGRREDTIGENAFVRDANIVHATEGGIQAPLKHVIVHEGHARDAREVETFGEQDFIYLDKGLGVVRVWDHGADGRFRRGDEWETASRIVDGFGLHRHGAHRNPDSSIFDLRHAAS